MTDSFNQYLLNTYHIPATTPNAVGHGYKRDQVSPGDYHTKWSKSEKDKYDITYMKNLKYWYKWTCLQNRYRLTDLENKLMVKLPPKGEGAGEG